MSLDRILLVPGLVEPPIMMWPLRYYLSRHFPDAEIWRDRMAFRDLQSSVQRLRDRIAGSDGERIGIVTHSFGDWITRQALHRAEVHRVKALVSVAPVMRSGLLTSLTHLVSGNLIPEIEVIADREEAAALAAEDLGVPRLVLWARVDECVSRIDLPADGNIAVEDYVATHLTIILQPNVHRRITDFLSEPRAAKNTAQV